MSRFTTAYSALVDRLTEVEDLRSAAAKKEKEDAVKYRTHINSLCRGAIVLLCAHLEAYIRELGETALDSIFTKSVDRSKISKRVFYNISKSFIQEVKDTEDHDALAEKLITFLKNDSVFWATNGPFPQPLPADPFNAGFSNPSFSKIRAYFNRFGYDSYKSDLERTLKGDFLVGVNMVDQLVSVRNAVAHGDRVATRTPLEIKVMIKLIRTFAMVTDVTFSNWCGKNLCAIRRPGPRVQTVTV